MSSHKSPANVGKILLGAVVLFYCIMQWSGAHNMAGNIIFSSHRAEDRRDLSSMIQQLTGDLRKICASGPMRKVVFDDYDVILPYLLPAPGDTSFSHCEFIRETNVTPLAEALLADCKTIRVLEYTLLNRTSNAPPAFAITPHPEDWTAISRWISPESNLGFAIFKRAGCPNTGDDRDAKR
jgi:hypothetical protein